jgi:hypothetical protein
MLGKRPSCRSSGMRNGCGCVETQEITKQHTASARRSCYAAKFSVISDMGQTEPRMILELPQHLRRHSASLFSTGLVRLYPDEGNDICSYPDALPRNFLRSQRLYRRVFIFPPCNITGSAKTECTSQLEYFLGFVGHTGPIELHRHASR